MKIHILIVLVFGIMLSFSCTSYKTFVEIQYDENNNPKYNLSDNCFEIKKDKAYLIRSVIYSKNIVVKNNIVCQNLDSIVYFDTILEMKRIKNHYSYVSKNILVELSYSTKADVSYYNYSRNSGIQFGAILDTLEFENKEYYLTFTQGQLNTHGKTADMYYVIEKNNNGIQFPIMEVKLLDAGKQKILVKLFIEKDIKFRKKAKPIKGIGPFLQYWPILNWEELSYAKTFSSNHEAANVTFNIENLDEMKNYFVNKIKEHF